MSIESELREMITEIVRTELRATLADARLVAANENVAAPTSEYLSDVQVADWIGVSRETLQAMRRRADGPPFVQVARRAIRYHVPAVRAWLATRVVGK